MALTLYNKLIMGNRKGQALLAGGATAAILGVSAFRQLEEDSKEINPVKLAGFAGSIGVLAGILWSCTTAARRKSGSQDSEIVKSAVRPVVIIGLAATLKDMEDERYFRKYSGNGSANGQGSHSYSYSESSYSRGYNKAGYRNDSRSESIDYPSPVKGGSVWLSRGESDTYSSLASNPANDADDDETLTSLGTAVRTRLSSKYDNAFDDDDDISACDTDFINNLLT